MSGRTLLLTDLPAELKEKIANVLDYNSKMSLRQVTKDFKEAVDNSEFFYDRLELMWSSMSRSIFLTLCIKSEGNEIRKDLKFSQNSNCDAWINGFTVRNDESEKCVVGTNYNYIDAAMERFWKILKHKNRAKIHLNSICHQIPRHFLEATEEWFLADMRQFNEKFKPDLSIKTKLSVSKLELEWSTDPEFYLNVVSCVKPGVLEELSIGHVSDYTRIAETAQWKQAKCLECDNLPPGPDTAHFSTLKWQKEEVELEQIKELVDQFFRNPTWQKRHITYCSFDKEAFEKHFFENNTGDDRNVIRRGRDACRLELENTIENCNIIIDRVTE